MGTYEEPNRLAVGVLATIVNGVPVVDEGRLIVDAAPGRPIRLSAKTDSRAQVRGDAE